MNKEINVPEKQIMTVHRALAELKLLDARINKGMQEITPVAFNQKGKKINNITEVAEFETSTKSNFQSVIDLIARKDGIKKAIVRSNGTTQLTVANKQMTVADAISYKALVTYKKQLIALLRQKTVQQQAIFNRNNELVQANAQKLAEVYFGKESGKKMTESDVEALQKPYIEMNEFHWVDPLKVEQQCKAIEKEVGEFEADVDAALSVSNATTTIEI